VARRPPPSDRFRLAAACWYLAACADGFLLFVVLWLAGPQGWSGLELAVVILALRLPAMAGGMAGGRAVDRFGGRPVMLLSGLAGAAAFCVLTVVGWSGSLPLGPVILLGGALGALTPATYAGARWFAGRLVAPGELARANAALSLGDLVPTVVGGALVGPMLELLGPGPALLLPAFMLLASAALANRLPRLTGHAPLPGRADPAHPSAQARGRAVGALIALSTVYYFAFGPFETGSPTLVRESLGGGAALYGTLWMVFGLCALLALPLSPRLARTRPGVANALGAAAWGIAILPAVLLESASVALASFALAGAIWGPYTSVEATALHRWSPSSRHGRIFGLQRGLLSAAMPLGAAVGALAMEHANANTVLAISAATCSIAGVAALAVPSLRAATPPSPAPRRSSPPAPSSLPDLSGS